MRKYSVQYDTEAGVDNIRPSPSVKHNDIELSFFNSEEDITQDMIRFLALGEYLFSTCLSIVTTVTLVLTYKTVRKRTSKYDLFLRLLLISAFFFAGFLVLDGSLWIEYCISDNGARSNYPYALVGFFLYASFSFYDACSIVLLIQRNCALLFPSYRAKKSLKILFAFLLSLILGGAEAMIVKMLSEGGGSVPIGCYVISCVSPEAAPVLFRAETFLAVRVFSSMLYIASGASLVVLVLKRKVKLNKLNLFVVCVLASRIVFGSAPHIVDLTSFLLWHRSIGSFIGPYIKLGWSCDVCSTVFFYYRVLLTRQRSKQAIRDKWLIEIGKEMVAGNADQARNMSLIIDSVVQFAEGCVQLARAETDELESVFARELGWATPEFDDDATTIQGDEIALSEVASETASRPGSAALPVPLVIPQDDPLGSAAPTPPPPPPIDACESQPSTSLLKLEARLSRASTPTSYSLFSDANRTQAHEKFPFGGFQPAKPKGTLSYYTALASNVFFGDGTHFVLRDGNLKNLSVVNAPLSTAGHELKLYSQKEGNTAEKVQKIALFYGDKLMSMGKTAYTVHSLLMSFLQVLREVMPQAQIYVFTVPLAPSIMEEAKRFNELLEETIGPSNLKNSFLIELAGVVDMQVKEHEWKSGGAEMSPQMAFTAFHEVLKLCGIGKTKKRRASESAVSTDEPSTSKGTKADTQIQGRYSQIGNRFLR
ncbi:hypothetical protein QR680_009772 [Steinernema hermaphroditum]|uniref:Uncharacterized protein n=1 Tax=Steinernema hermaphroditum TaxID=289476 RepID=A0AA39MAI7_9BILA|nr:hypothetical protein QR680_009772 [Steinernema hermaphroditum]